MICKVLADKCGWKTRHQGFGVPCRVCIMPLTTKSLNPSTATRLNYYGKRCSNTRRSPSPKSDSTGSLNARTPSQTEWPSLTTRGSSAT